MVPFHSLLHPHSSALFSTPTPLFHSRFPRSKRPLRPPHYFSVNAASQSPFQYADSNSQTSQPVRPKTLYPSGFKRPEIKVPNLVLQLEPEEILGDGDALDLIDKAISRWVGIVVLNGGEGNGGRVYEAACKLKSVVRDRAYLLITERVDIAAAVNASGVVLSDQGLPAIVARNTMLDSTSESVFLPLVARAVKSTNSAINASNSEGADFLLYVRDEEENSDAVTNSVFKNVKIPIFIILSACKENRTINVASKLLMSGASGFVMTPEVFKLFSDETLGKLFDSISMAKKREEDDIQSLDTLSLLDIDSDFLGTRGIASFVKLEDKEKHFIELEKSVLLETINVIKRAAPLMEEVSLLTDAVSQLDEPFMLAIVGEFNSGKSSVINALLGRKYLKEGVVPTTNEITFLRYSESSSSEPQRCERLPDGQYICYLPAPILKEMNIVDTPGTNVILQRQQRLTEEFVPRADLLLFVISADRPLTESEVVFLRYTQQWKKKVVFVLNKSDIYQNAYELEEALSFIKQNVKKLLNTGHVTIYPVSARAALNEKLSAFSDPSENHGAALLSDSNLRSNGFHEFEEFLYSFLDGSTSTGMERMKLKLETPIGIADRLISACITLVQQDCLRAKQDLASVNELVDSVRKYATKMESESISWKRQVQSLIDSTKLQIVRLIESSLQLSNLDLVISYALKGEGVDTIKTSSKIQSGIISPAKSDAQKLLQEYVVWLRSSNSQEGILYKESFEKQWPSVDPNLRDQFATYELLKKIDEISLTAVENFSAGAASNLFERRVRETFLGTFGGLGAAGLSASLLTSVLPTTLEDLLALGLCSAGGFLAISRFPSRRRDLIEKVKKTADGLGRELDEAMQKDLEEANKNMETFVSIVSKPYLEDAQLKVDTLLEIENELTTLGKKLETLRVGIQNLHVL